MNPLSHIIRFVFIMAAQILIFNHLNFASGLIYPQLYVLFLLFLPAEMVTWVVIIIGFFTGLLVDLRHHACLFMIEKYSWLNFIDSFLKILLSALFTVIISVVFQLLFNPPKAKS